MLHEKEYKKYKEILKVINDLENEYDNGGSEDGYGGLTSGNPDWDKAKEEIKKIMEEGDK